MRIAVYDANTWASAVCAEESGALYEMGSDWTYTDETGLQDLSEAVQACATCVGNPALVVVGFGSNGWASMAHLVSPQHNSDPLPFYPQLSRTQLKVARIVGLIDAALKRDTAPEYIAERDAMFRQFTRGLQDWTDNAPDDAPAAVITAAPVATAADWSAEICLQLHYGSVLSCVSEAVAENLTSHLLEIGRVFGSEIAHQAATARDDGVEYIAADVVQAVAESVNAGRLDYATLNALCECKPATRRVTVTATTSESLSAVVDVPVSWSPDDILNYYRELGASGEFTSGGTDWNWEGVAMTPDAPAAVDTLTGEPVQPR
jgi:hypothetical protein